MERQRLAEWEKQRKAELMQHRQREQEKVLVLKAKHEHITNDLDKLVRTNNLDKLVRTNNLDKLVRKLRCTSLGLVWFSGFFELSSFQICTGFK